MVSSVPKKPKIFKCSVKGCIFIRDAARIRQPVRSVENYKLFEFSGMLQLDASANACRVNES